MKKTALAIIAILISAGTFTSCKKEATVKLTAPVLQLAGFKKDISTAD